MNSRKMTGATLPGNSSLSPQLCWGLKLELARATAVEMGSVDGRIGGKVLRAWVPQ